MSLDAKKQAGGQSATPLTSGRRKLLYALLLAAVYGGLALVAHKHEHFPAFFLACFDKRSRGAWNRQGFQIAIPGHNVLRPVFLDRYFFPNR